jgi:chromate transporter
MPAELRSLALLFVRLGTTAFGGPAAHIAMMEDEVVRRRRWMAREEFLDLVGATQVIPGPNSTELAIHIGHARAGWPGLLVAGVSFIVPAMLIVWAVAWAYVAYGTLPAVAGALTGVKAVVFAVVAQALWGLGRVALKGALTLAIGVTAFGAVLLGVHELLVLAAAALVAVVDQRVTAGGVPRAALLPLAAAAGPALPAQASARDSVAALTGAAAAAGTAASAASAALGTLFLVFLKAGALLFGSGYVLLAFLRTDLVVRLGWLTEAQLLDAVAAGQVTPGPVFTTATFIGYVLAGHTGALLATLGIFLPAFVFVALTAPFIRRLRTSPVMAAGLDGVNVASLALMAAVCIPLGRDALSGPVPALLCAAALVLLLRWRVNSAWLVLGGGLAGWLAL